MTAATKRAKDAIIQAEGFTLWNDYETPSEDEIAFSLAYTRYTDLARDLNAAADAILEADLLPTPMPVARELLQVERERLARDHYASFEYNCDGCERLGAIVAELREIG